MSGMLGFHSREAIRVKVKKCEGLLPPEYRKFSVDPQITSFEVLQSLLARAFDIKGEFTISYLAKDEEGYDTYLSLLSDWDLDAAFLGSSDPCLQLKVDLKPFEEGLEDWDVISPLDIPRAQVTGPTADRAGLRGAILNHMEKTFIMVQRALNLGDAENEAIKPLKPPVSDIEFHTYLDGDGRLLKPKELRLSVYRGGIEPSLRKVVWKHLLNVYPIGMTGKDRISYIKQKSTEYQKLRSVWQDMVGGGNVTEEIQYVTNMVRKDVLRTDRTHKFYAGSDDNKNVVSLFNILTTYALNHPSVSYCQGMSDLASPILVTMKDESHAYVCFCALMQRLKSNFFLDGKAMTIKFQHLTELLEHYDPQFFEYLKQQGADDLLFCYRWLLLELKREFAFEDALYMLEVLWSSIPPSPPDNELMLYEEQFTPNTARPQSPRFHSRENPYTKVRAIRKQNSASSIRGLVKATEESPQEVPSLAPPKENDDSQEYLPMTTSMTRELRMELENLNRHLPGSCRLLQRSLTVDSEDLDSPRSQEGYDLTKTDHPARFQRQASIDQSIEEDCKSWTSDELSSGDQIWKSNKRQPKYLECTQPNGSVEESADSVHCCTPDEQCDLEFDEQGKMVTTEITCNGEILENEESGCSCHLKSVIPIRLVHSPITTDQYNCRSDSSDSSSENSQTRIEDQKEVFAPNSNHQSEGYESESSKETSIQDLDKNQNGFIDSGVVQSVMTNSCEEALDFNTKRRPSSLRPPQELGCGNPFMLFLCLTLLLQHRDVVVRNCMDYNELAMYFDKMVRKHHVQRVLNQARAMFTEYLQFGWQEDSYESSTDPQV
ncbi:TBC1 domain family member 25-like [Centruroides sculpturatus]|uniref:TBC1 domain family member 25-like n=1 Tax=Centruroides sculpturatus TaxID=218467 RepID=UPI000C6CA57A|nr:TBC1 domain family member 25-like [Centruroides sculpturatus]